MFIFLALVRRKRRRGTKVSLDLDIHVVIFVKDLNGGRSQKGGWRERVLNEMHNILGDASTLNLPNCMSIFVYLYL